jgi:hypothetical protein
MTNVPLTEQLRADVAHVLEPVLSGSALVLNGRSEVAADLDRFPNVRTSYPQILGLGDLRKLISSAVSRDVIARSTLALEATAELAPAFVPTRAYDNALSLLSRRNFTVLLGPPEMGKTAIARIVALTRHLLGWEVIDCRHPSDVYRMYEREHHQVFLADDAFGSTEYRPEIATEWAAVLEQLMSMMDRHHWLVWTSRPAPLREGLRQLHLQGAASTFPTPQEVEVDASKLSLAEKSQMLYRHARAANVGRDAADLLRTLARDIVQSPHFTPLRIRRLVTQDLPDVMALPPSLRSARLLTAVEQGLRAPTPAMETSFNVLSEERRALLFSMLNSPGGASEASWLSSQMEAFLGRVPGESVEALAESLDDHFVRRRRRSRDFLWT